MLTLTSKTPVKFLWSDALSETAVVLSPDDDDMTLRDKLQRVLELSGDRLPVRQPGAALAAAQVEFPPLWDAEAAEAALAKKTGWEGLADIDIEDLPEA